MESHILPKHLIRFCVGCSGIFEKDKQTTNLLDRKDIRSCDFIFQSLYIQGISTNVKSAEVITSEDENNL